MGIRDSDWDCGLALRLDLGIGDLVLDWESGLVLEIDIMIGD